MRLVQHVTLDSGNHQYHNTTEVLKRHFGTCEPHEKIDNKLIEFNLNECKQPVYYGNKSVDSDIELLQDQQSQLAERIQPTTTGKTLRIMYTLETMLEFEGTCCNCSGIPNCEINMFIQPPHLPNYQQFQVPPNWNPNIYNVKQIPVPGQIFDNHAGYVVTPQHSSDGEDAVNQPSDEKSNVMGQNDEPDDVDDSQINHSEIFIEGKSLTSPNNTI